MGRDLYRAAACQSYSRPIIASPCNIPLVFNPSIVGKKELGMLVRMQGKVSLEMLMLETRRGALLVIADDMRSTCGHVPPSVETCKHVYLGQAKDCGFLWKN